MRVRLFGFETLIRACVIVAVWLGSMARAADFGKIDERVWAVTDSVSGERWVLFSEPPNYTNSDDPIKKQLLESGILLTGNSENRSVAADALGSIKSVFSNPSGLYSAESFVGPNMNRVLLLDLRSDKTFILEQFLKVTKVDSGAVITLKNERFVGNFRFEGGRIELLFSKTNKSTSLQLEREGNDLITCNSMRIRYRAHAR